MAKKFITMVDADNEARMFDEEDLVRQLVSVKIPGSEPAKYAYRHFAGAVHKMRRLQKDYFAAKHGTKEKEWLLKACKAAESTVDAILKRSQDIELL